MEGYFGSCAGGRVGFMDHEVVVLAVKGSADWTGLVVQHLTLRW